MSERRDDGGPAFPCPWGCDTTGQHLCSDPKGMTLRDYFAAAALQGMLARADFCLFGDPDSPDCGEAFYGKLAATNAYAIADAMLAERQV